MKHKLHTFSFSLKEAIKSHKTHFRSSWVEAMEAFTDVTKLVEAFGLGESIL